LRTGFHISVYMENETLKNLFQQEFSKIVAVISRRYGLEHIEIAEDIVSETFLLAAESWGIKGMPPNPAAWLYTVAKQKTLYHFRRNKIFEKKVIPKLKTKQKEQESAELDFTMQNIKDSQLQMIFAVCNPAIASEAQIGLALRILCGFGIDEIAEAFLSNKETINKRLYRAKEKLRTEKIEMEMPPENEIPGRLGNVLLVIYLLFNEGYYSRTQNRILQKDLCLEAMRLGLILTEYEKTNLPETNALLALMCFHSSRFDARQTSDDSFILYEEQDEKLWDKQLINRGVHFLNLSAKGNEITSYHIEAKIAYWHCMKEDSKEKWEDILSLYNNLVIVNFSPGVLLNRIYALYKVNGAKAALAEAEKLKFEDNHFYFLLLSELYKNIDKDKAEVNLQKAYSLAKTETEKGVIQRKIESLSN
jgi:RNA polymerase sigma factor (sigma-70 family)